MNTEVVNSSGYKIKAKVINCNLVGDETNLLKTIQLSTGLC